MSNSGGNPVASLGGAGIATRGGAVVTLDSTGATRITLDDGSGEMVLFGQLALRQRAVSTTQALTARDCVLLATGGAGGITLTLPATTNGGRLIAVKKVDAGAGAVTVTPAAGTLDGAASQALTAQFYGIVVTWDGANWWTVAEIAPTIL